MWAARSIEEGPRDERREWPRYRLGRGIAVTMTADGRTWDCVVEDVSLGGARLRLDQPAPRNLEVRIERAPVGSVYGTRTWAAAGGMGVRFDLSPDALDLITHCLTRGEIRHTRDSGARAAF